MEEPNFKPIVLFSGYSIEKENGVTLAACTSVLIKGPPSIIIDTLSPWDGEKLKSAIEANSLKCADMNYVICTHGHSDHVGCNYLFPNAKQIVGYDICFENEYFPHDFSNGKEYVINNNVKIIPTPGHTLQDVSVIINDNDNIYAVTGDLFENEEDLEDAKLWVKAGSDCENLQRVNREKILKLADYIIPGHGKMFKVPSKYKLLN